MNLPSTTLGSNPVAFSSIARTSTSVTPRCSMRNSAWPVNERSQFHHSGEVGIELLAGPIVAPGHASKAFPDFFCQQRSSLSDRLAKALQQGGTHGGTPLGARC